MKYLAFLLIVAFIVACSNKTPKKVEEPEVKISSASNNNNMLLTVKRGACFGRCPIYDITIYQDGRMEYDGERFTTMLGPHTNKLNEQQLSQLTKMVNAIDWTSHPDKIPSNISDLPPSTVINHSIDPDKSIWWNTNGPKELVELRDLVATYLEIPNWVVSQQKVMPDNVMTNELLIKFNKDVDINDFINAHQEYGLMLKEQLIPKMPIWLCTYDESKITPNEMLNKVNSSDKVEMAEFNKKVTPRQK